MKITAIILTFNESRHLARCIESVRDLASHILVVDCFSSDSTVDIAKAAGAHVVQHPWLNYASQFNWALSQIDKDTEWVLRIDADELLDEGLVGEFLASLKKVGPEINGIYCGRRIRFQGKLIRYGGVFPVRVLRLFRYGCGQCENRWMDEHIKVRGATVDLQGEIIDDNLQSLSWWTTKHNGYASREAVDLLNLEYRFMPHDTVSNLWGGHQVGIKRWIKERVYASLPGGFRALFYFFYRYFVRFGFLDGKAGTAFHVLQGFWYRYLVDAKVAEVRRYMAASGCDVTEAIEHILGIRVVPLPPRMSENDID